jgi:hypothetical protein
MRDEAKPLVEHVIGGWKNTYFWHENWLPFGAIVNKFGDQMIGPNIPKNAKVAEVIRRNRCCLPDAISDKALKVWKIIESHVTIYSDEALKNLLISKR